MFDFLAEQDASICGGSHLKRREFLQVGVLGAAGLSLPQLLAAKEAGAAIEITGFLRFELGEGVEKKESNFAAEVAAAQSGS